MFGFPFPDCPLLETVSIKEDCYSEEEDSFSRIILDNIIVHPTIESDNCEIDQDIDNYINRF